MAIIEAFPGPPAAVDSVELRKDLNGQIARDTTGAARGGIFPRSTGALLVARADMQVDVVGFDGAAVRGGGPLFMQNDGTIQVTIGTAPVSNSRIDVVYFQQQENGYNSFADGSNAPRIAVLAGTAAPTPTKPSLAAIPGAQEIGTVQIASGSTATNQGGVTITTTAQYTASSGGVVLLRNQTDENAWAPGDGAVGYRIDTGRMINRRASFWRPIPQGFILGEWHVNIAAGSAGGQPMGPGGATTFVVGAVAYARMIRVVVMGGVLTASAGDGGVSIVPSTGAWVGGSNVHRIQNNGGGTFTDMSHTFQMLSLPANTALTLTLTSQSSVNTGYDLHFQVQEA